MTARRQPHYAVTIYHHPSFGAPLFYTFEVRDVALRFYQSWASAMAQGGFRCVQLETLPDHKPICKTVCAPVKPVSRSQQTIVLMNDLPTSDVDWATEMETLANGCRRF